MTNIPAVVNPRAPKRMVGCELLNLAAHNPADLVQLSEQQYQSRIDAAAAYVLASGRRIVMLTGPSAAGKTTSAVTFFNPMHLPWPPPCAAKACAAGY